MIAHDRKVILVTRQTALEELVMRYHTLQQVRFYLENLGMDMADYEEEHHCYLTAKAVILARLEKWGRYQCIDRGFLTNFLFGADDMVIVLGPDGLVANTMKYLTGQPLIGVNPSPNRYDGALLPFISSDIDKLLPEVAFSKRACKEVTMAKASLTDGQILYAVNDLFIGCKTHMSARYELAINDQQEIQSSSGIIVSTGLGSTGWMKSVITGAKGLANALGMIATDSQIKVKSVKGKPSAVEEASTKLTWDSKVLQFAVREPFPSQRTQTNIVAGVIHSAQCLEITSQMPEQGVIFSDGIEADFLNFTAGMVAKVGVADRVGALVV